MQFNKDNWIKSALRDKYIVALTDGRIFRRTAQKGEDSSPVYKLVKLQKHKKSGRVYFNMTWRDVRKSVLVNRVVALAYLPNPNNLPQVNHIDGDLDNNALYQADGSLQLEWCTASENEKHAHRNGLKSGRGSANANSKLNADQVIEIRKSVMSVPELCEAYGVARSTINNILKRKTWKHL